MAAPMKNHARICLVFDTRDLESSWFLVKYAEMPLISDICQRLNSRYSLTSSKKKQIVIRLQSSILPDWESSELLQDNDRINVSVERIPTSLEDDNKKKRRRQESVSENPDTDEPVVKKKRQTESAASTQPTPTTSDNIKIRDFFPKPVKLNVSPAGDNGAKTTTNQIVSSKIDSLNNDNRLNVSSDGDNGAKTTANQTVSNKVGSSNNDNRLNVSHDGDKAATKKSISDKSDVINDDNSVNDLDESTSDINGSLKKRKRIRKHRKRKNKQHDEGGENVAENETQVTVQTNTYKGREISKDESFFGSFPDKLVAPKHYRHGYRNLNVYQPEPNKHTKFGDSGDEKSVSKNTEQYNFMSSTKVLAEKEEYRKSQQEDFNGDFFPDTDNEIKATRNDTNSKATTDNKSFISDQKYSDTINGPSQTISSTSSPVSNVLDRSVNKSTERVNGYQSDTVTRDHRGSAFQFKCPSSEPRPVRKACIPVPSQLTRKTLANGASVYTRQRPGRRQQQTNSHFEMSKEDQLNTVATNYSTIFFNPEKEQETISDHQIDTDKQPDKEPNSHNDDEKEQIEKINGEDNSVLSVVDFTKLPPLKGEPKKGDKIVYKVLELSATCTPEISDYREAIVLGVDKNQMVELQNINLTENKKNRFHVEIEDDNEVLTSMASKQERVQLHLSSMLDTKIVQST